MFIVGIILTLISSLGIWAIDPRRPSVAGLIALAVLTFLGLSLMLLSI